MDQYRHTKDHRDFVRVVQVGTALALGVMAAFLYSLKQVHPSIHLEFQTSNWTPFRGLESSKSKSFELLDLS